jgi:2-polyprenyl-3-methyl-5-hydroxy-6-metoxy-1,4-benzoquinol methylase
VGRHIDLFEFNKSSIKNVKKIVEFVSDVVLIPHNGGVISSNHRVRRHIWINNGLLSSLLGIDSPDKKAINMTRFTNIDGLLSDPTGLDSSSEDIVVFEHIDEAIKFLQLHWIVKSEESKYLEFLNKKSNILDNKHMGTFHQQLGEELIIKNRLDPESWWYQQKFNVDTGLVKDNLYKYIQENFIEDYFNGLKLNGKVVLDFGCGSGIVARKFLNLGASKVIGIDPDVEHLNKASELSPPEFVPIHIDLNSSNYLNIFDNLKFDIVWMSDVFHFYFYSPDANTPKVTAKDLLCKMCEKMESGNKCIIMQPHGVFWLAPWLGNENLPFTVISEYSNKLYSVVPSLSEMTKAISSSGFVINNIYEPKPDKHDGVSKESSFASEFPLWWVFECEKR